MMVAVTAELMLVTTPRLLNAETKAVLREAKVPRHDTARKFTWDLAEFAGQRAVIQVTDGDDGHGRTFESNQGRK